LRHAAVGLHFILAQLPHAVKCRLAQTLGGTKYMSPPSSTVKYQDLEAALEWASSGAPFENTAIINRQTGEVFFKSMDGYSEEELPEDIDDGTLYVAIPHKNDLNLGREVVFDFIESESPSSIGIVSAFFRQRGAYSKYKAFLERESLLDKWYKFESQASGKALLRWASENGFNVTEVPSAA
jgi:hypothetical protein